MSALFRKHESRLPANSARAANDKKDLPAELGLRRHPLQLRFLQYPIFNAEGFRPRQGHVVVKLGKLLRLFPGARLGQPIRSLTVFKRIGTGHDMDGVDEELRGDARLFLVLAEAKQAHARNDHHGRI